MDEVRLGCWRRTAKEAQLSAVSADRIFSAQDGPIRESPKTNY